MDIGRIQDNIRGCSSDTEGIYTRIASCFPALLSINTQEDSSSLPATKTLLDSISGGFSEYRQDEVSFFEIYNAKNVKLFTALNERMGALDRITERVSAIRSDSEELEIISLNAMVISIKSGEKGRAFSCITENLKKLSAGMISLSNELIQEERELLGKNESLKKSFSAVLDAQKEAVSACALRRTVDIGPTISEASGVLDRMTANAAKVSAPIQDAMAGVQLQDIIRQSVDQIILVLPEICTIPEGISNEERLDRLSLNAQLLDIAINIMRDVNANLELSLQTFSTNWKQVHEILDAVEDQRRAFIGNYLDERNLSGSSLPVLLSDMTDGFCDYISHINLYQRGQRTLVRDSTRIVAEAKRLRTLFDTIRPIISRLQHVRITQQIEVAKNLAIGAVKDTVEYMSELIMKADSRVKETRAELEDFITGIDELASSYSAVSDADNRELERIKQEKSSFFNRMKQYHADILSVVSGLHVYPESFQSLCTEVDDLLARLEGVHARAKASSRELMEIRDAVKVDLDHALGAQGLAVWTIKNDRFRDIVDRFTITAHKEAAGKIAGFEVDSNSLETIESGDVTLFF